MMEILPERLSVFQVQNGEKFSHYLALSDIRYQKITGRCIACKVHISPQNEFSELLIPLEELSMFADPTSIHTIDVNDICNLVGAATSSELIRVLQVLFPLLGSEAIFQK
ncbi:hypothetical protein NB559_16500 [Vibrio parahaemolyticus]|uniref:hypothetical protein n=2 Tax=Vibrio parahaemolyticus TaxID=670 RepID=UPI001111D813|nr:hypothetical protein [Vibrio parahaemolyticus]MCR9651454.1 hypothetical protein [Vibrio parahaemolyticus]